MPSTLCSPNFRAFGAFFTPQKVKKHIIFHLSASISGLALRSEQSWGFYFFDRLKVLNQKKKGILGKRTYPSFQRAITEKNTTSERSPKIFYNRTYFLPKVALRLWTVLCVFGQKSKKHTHLLKNHILVFFEANHFRIRCQKLFWHLFHEIFCALGLTWSLGHL